MRLSTSKACLFLISFCLDASSHLWTKALGFRKTNELCDHGIPNRAKITLGLVREVSMLTWKRADFADLPPNQGLGRKKSPDIGHGETRARSSEIPLGLLRGTLRDVCWQKVRMWSFSECVTHSWRSCCLDRGKIPAVCSSAPYLFQFGVSSWSWDARKIEFLVWLDGHKAKSENEISRS